MKLSATKIVKKFAFLPIEIRGKRYWLRFVNYEQKWDKDKKKWITTRVIGI